MFFFFLNVSNLDVYFLNFNEKLDISTLIAADDRMTDSLSHLVFVQPYLMTLKKHVASGDVVVTFGDVI